MSFIKVLIGAVAVVVLMIGAPNAISDYQSGFQFGVSDGMGSCIPPHKCGADEYITHLGNGFQFHSWDFVRGYVIGWCSVGRKWGLSVAMASSCMRD